MNYRSLKEISTDVIKCKKCDLYKTRNNSVPGKGKKRNKIIFDGYPRNLSQAKNLEVLLKGDKQTVGSIIYLNLSVLFVRHHQ